MRSRWADARKGEVREAGTKNRATPERRRAILEGALAVFLERGFERATLEAICARVGVTKGSVYHHFTSKEQIAVTLYSEAIGSLQAEIASAISDASSAREVILRLVSSYLAWFQRQPALGAFVFQVMDGHALDAYAEPVRATRVAFIDALAARLEELLVIPPDNASAPKRGYQDKPGLYTGNENEPATRAKR